jgi:hypothetical protein
MKSILTSYKILTTAYEDIPKCGKLLNRLKKVRHARAETTSSSGDTRCTIDLSCNSPDIALVGCGRQRPGFVGTKDRFLIFIEDGFELRDSLGKTNIGLQARGAR